MATRRVEKEEKEENDPTGEEPALEYDGTKTDQLDDTYRILVASMSEGWNVESDAAEMSPTAADNQTSDMPRMRTSWAQLKKKRPRMYRQ